MIQVGDEAYGYVVVATDGDNVLVDTPVGIQITFGRKGFEGNLKQLLCFAGISIACEGNV